MDASGEHEILLIVRGEDKDGWWAKFRLHEHENLDELLNANRGSRLALRYLGDE